MLARNPLDVLYGDTPPTFIGGDIGPSFFTPGQNDFRNNRQRYGGVDDPNTASYHLSEIVFDKETGSAALAVTDPLPDAWYSTMPDCGCKGGGNCGCG